MAFINKAAYMMGYWCWQIFVIQYQLPANLFLPFSLHHHHL